MRSVLFLNNSYSFFLQGVLLLSEHFFVRIFSMTQSDSAQIIFLANNRAEEPDQGIFFAGWIQIQK